VRTYRAQLHSHLDGPEGDEAARSRVERWANEHRGSDLIVRYSCLYDEYKPYDAYNRIQSEYIPSILDPQLLDFRMPERGEVIYQRIT
jgi:hypothetical protein